MKLNSFIFAVPLFVVFLAGCLKSDENTKTVIEQQRVNLETLKQNQETLEKIHQKEKDLAEREREIEKKSKINESKEKELAAFAKELNDKSKEVNEQIDKLNKYISEAKEHEKRIALYAELSKKRIPFCENLAIIAAKGLRANAITPPAIADEYELLMKTDPARKFTLEYRMKDQAEKYWYQQILQELQSNGLNSVDSEEQFQNLAKQCVERFVKRNAGEIGYEKFREKFGNCLPKQESE
jgi:outer membrane murein-binding lipoprotein Lpp